MENRNFLRLFLASLSMGVLLLATGCSLQGEEAVEVTDDAAEVMEAPVVVEPVVEADVVAEEAMTGDLAADEAAAVEAGDVVAQ